MEKTMLVDKNGEEVKWGDTIKIIHEYITTYNGIPLSTTSEIKDIVVTEDNIKSLIRLGFLRIVEKETVKYDFDFFVKKLSLRIKLPIDKTTDYLYETYKMSKSAAFSIILKEIAIELDKKYENHIRNSKEIYAISLTNGKICRIDKSKVTTYEHFAAFRTIEDARLACSVLNKTMKIMFKVNGTN